MFRLGFFCLMVSLLGVFGARGAVSSTRDSSKNGDVQARMVALEFTSDHNLLCRDGTDLLSHGGRYPDVEWSAKQPNFVAPMSHTQGKTVEARILIHLSWVPVGSKIRVVGQSENEAFAFEGTGVVEEMGGDPRKAVVHVKGKKLLPAQMRKLEANIHWMATLEIPGENAKPFDLGATEGILCFLTRGIPRRGNEESSAVTQMRIRESYSRLATALETGPENPSAVAIVHALTSYCGKWYNPKIHMERFDAWRVPTTWRSRQAGASCISICNYCSLIFDQIGMEGAISQVEIWASPEQPTTAQIGGVDSEDFFKNIGPYQCQLFLADDRNTRLGQVGGWGGMNHYEGCIVFNYNNRTYYFPGGTDRVYEDKNTVLYIFRTLVWARYDNSRKEWQVVQVVKTYTPPRNGAPANCEIP